MSERCRSCNAKVIWTETERGRRMPVDATPVATGNLILRQREHRCPLAVHIDSALEPLRPHEAAIQERYVSHFVTCPDRKNWRKKKR